MDESLEVLAGYWDPEQMQMLANYGISLQDVHQAYRWMQQELSPLRMPRFGRVWRREAVVVDLLHRVELPSSSTSAQIVAGRKALQSQRRPHFDHQLRHRCGGAFCVRSLSMSAAKSLAGGMCGGTE